MNLTVTFQVHMADKLIVDSTEVDTDRNKATLIERNEKIIELLGPTEKAK